jgi:uncharacterized protein YciI
VRHFIVELTYTVPFEQLANALPAHRAYLQVGYDQGWLLFSGPQVPKTGGIIVARAHSEEDLKQFFRKDPFQKQGLATYRYIEFEPVKRQRFIEAWVTHEIA